MADSGASIKTAALKKLEGDVEVDGAQRAKVAVRCGVALCQMGNGVSAYARAREHPFQACQDSEYCVTAFSEAGN